jgi:hypothetical protein
VCIYSQKCLAQSNCTINNHYYYHSNLLLLWEKRLGASDSGHPVM